MSIRLPRECAARLERCHFLGSGEALCTADVPTLNDGGQRIMSRITQLGSMAAGVFAIAVLWAGGGQATPEARTFALSDTKDLVVLNVKAEAVEYKGRKAVRITKEKDTAKGDFDGFAFLKGTDFQDGTIEADIALKITTPPGVRMPGFVGIAFRARPDGSRYELFYLRPGNSHAEDQAMRNHSVQYSSEPDFGWERLRRQWPSVYESHEELQGGVALWGYQGEEAYFSNLRITNSTPLPVKNGSEASGSWQVKCATDAGPIQGALDLKRDGNKVTGSWSGELGKDRSVTGTWRNGYVELSFNVDWPLDDKGTVAPAVATLAGWFDGDSAGGRAKVEGRADGRWSATRKP